MSDYERERAERAAWTPPTPQQVADELTAEAIRGFLLERVERVVQVDDWADEIMAIVVEHRPRATDA